MKKFLLLTSILLTISVQAQDIKPSFSKNTAKTEQLKAETLKAIEDVVKYNAKVIGYAKFCKLNEAKSKSILNYFNNLMGTMNLIDDDAKKLETTFIDTARDSSQGKNLPQGFNCQSFSQTFDGIYSYIQTGQKAN